MLYLGRLEEQERNLIRDNTDTRQRSCY